MLTLKPNNPKIYSNLNNLDLNDPNNPINPNNTNHGPESPPLLREDKEARS